MREPLRKALAVVALAWSTHGCGSSERAAPPPPPRLEDAAVEAAITVEVAPLGTPTLEAWGWRGGPGAAAFARALEAERAGDLVRLEREAAAALAADGGHFEAAWLVAVARARLGRHAEVLAPLAVAAAGDWPKWGERSLVLGALADFRATAAGRGWVAAGERYRAAYAQALGRAVIVVGARAGGRGGAGRELYAVDPDSGRWLRLTRTGGALAGTLVATGAPWLAYVTARKGRGGHTSVRVGVVDRGTGRAARELAIDDAKAVTLAWRARAGEVELVARITPAKGPVRAAVVDWRHGKLAPLAKPPRLTGERLEIGAAGVGLRRLPIAAVSADWDDTGTAGALRFDRSGKVIAEPGGGLIDGDAVAVAPAGARAAFLTALTPPCDDTTRAAYAVEVASGQVRLLARGDLSAPMWLDDERVALTSGAQVIVYAAATGKPVATIAGGAGVTTPTTSARRACVEAAPLFADPEPPEADDWPVAEDDAGVDDAALDQDAGPAAADPDAAP